MQKVEKSYLLVAGLFTLISSSAFAQVPALRRPQTVIANDPRYKRAVTDEVTAATTTPTSVSGTFVAKFTIKLSTPVPSGYSVLCQLYASVTDENTSTYTINNEIDDAAGKTATISGSTATCTVTLPYQWYLTDTSTDTAHLSYYLYIVDTAATNGNAESRTSTQYVPGAGAIKIPSNGATTSYSISATL